MACIQCVCVHLCVCVYPLVCHADFSKTTVFTHFYVGTLQCGRTRLCTRLREQLLQNYKAQRHAVFLKIP